jgi:hypothetical protein
MKAGPADLSEQLRLRVSQLEDEKNALLDYIEENIEKHSHNGGVISPLQGSHRENRIDERQLREAKDQEIASLRDQLEEA